MKYEKTVLLKDGTECLLRSAGAVELYRSLGFVEYGRNPRGFRARGGQWQELLLMRLELEP